MVYLYGAGEVPISIVSDPDSDALYYHTIRKVGRVTDGLAALQCGDTLGIRGPYGCGWPLDKALGKDVLIITGGLGCAPSVSIINYILNRRQDYGRLMILQGVKHSDDLIYRQSYDQWAKMPDTQVLLAADISTPKWPFFTGLITELLDYVTLDKENTLCMMCGPEPMMVAAVKRLKQEALTEDKIYLNLERSMKCALAHCGHCQLGPHFICKDGPVFCYTEVKSLLSKEGL